MIYPFPITVGAGGDSYQLLMESEAQYKQFLTSRESLTSFCETNVEIQNMSNMLNIDIHVFTYDQRTYHQRTYHPMMEIVQHQETFPKN